MVWIDTIKSVITTVSECMDVSIWSRPEQAHRQRQTYLGPFLGLLLVAHAAAFLAFIASPP